jgi:hypothetical protein
MEWVVVFVIVLILAALLVVQRSGWSSGFTLSRDRFHDDLTLRTRMAEDDVKRAIDQRDGKDVAP